jgi:hypothetical protein
MNLPSSWIEAEPAFSAASNAATALRDHSTSAGDGVRISFATGTWSGWMHILPWKPSPLMCRVEALNPSASLRSTHTVSSGASMPAAREASTHSLR